MVTISFKSLEDFFIINLKTILTRYWSQNLVVFISQLLFTNDFKPNIKPIIFWLHTQTMNEAKIIFSFYNLKVNNHTRHETGRYLIHMNHIQAVPRHILKIVLWYQFHLKLVIVSVNQWNAIAGGHCTLYCFIKLPFIFWRVTFSLRSKNNVTWYFPHWKMFLKSFSHRWLNTSQHKNATLFFGLSLDNCNLIFLTSNSQTSK
jgi:hypothetical protein